MLRSNLAAVALLVAVLPVPAQAQVKLEWKFKEGDTFSLENVTSQKGFVQLLANKLPLDASAVTVSRFKVLKVQTDAVVLEQKIESVKMKGGVGALSPQLVNQLTGSTFTVTLNDKGEITKFDGFDAFVKKVAKNNEQVANMVKMAMPEDFIKQGIQEVLAFVPGKEVAKGESWKRQLGKPLGPLGSFRLDMEYTYEGKVADGEQIAAKAVYQYMPPKADAGGLLFKITKGDLKTEEAKGTVIFDANAGRLVRHDSKARLKGTLTVQVADQESPVDMELEMSSTSRILKGPLKK